MNGRTEYFCHTCGHRVTVLSDETVPLYCSCIDEQPLMKPANGGDQS
jgi:hypothetical protein